jgi:hypothetical protein
VAGGRRILGLELGGGRRTAIVCLDFFPSEGKVFLESSQHPHGTREETADEALIRSVNALSPELIAVDAPLTLPPCLDCALPLCPGAMECTVPSVRWMREEAARRRWAKAKFPPPYTHRPVDLLMRGRWQDDAPLSIPTEEVFGSGRAPLTARMRYLRRHLQAASFLEANPRFALAGIAEWYGLSVRELRRCRDVEYGAENRFLILNKITAQRERPELPHVFLYMTDIVSIAKDLSTFDALLCGLMGLFSQLGLLEAPELDPAWGTVARPKSPEVARGRGCGQASPPGSGPPSRRRDGRRPAAPSPAP